MSFQLTKKKLLGMAVLALALIGGSSLGVLSNYTVPAKPQSITTMSKPVVVKSAPKKKKKAARHKKQVE